VSTLAFWRRDDEAGSGSAALSGRVKEQDLVAQAQAGDMESFGELYRRSLGRVYAVCRRLSGSPEAAEDLTQDVFVRAWEKISTFRGESAFSSWLHPLAVNLSLSALRSGRRGAARVVPAEDTQAPEPVAPPRQPEIGLTLETVIERLPAGAREVFVLHDVEGYRHEEIARLMGVAVGTTKAQLHRARRLLREALQ
jgi:RNA polymerase sigma-70 factor (ECF subfamily)